MIEDVFVVKPSRRESAEARRQAILDEACDLFFTRGYDPVSIAEIGAAAGISGPAIYRHFASKAELLECLCEQTIDRLIEFVGPRRDDPLAELTALVKGQVALVVHFPTRVRVFEEEERSLPPEVRRKVRRRERDHARRWVAALTALTPGMPEFALETLAFATVGMILSAPRWPRQLRADPTLARSLEQAAWRLLGPALDGIGISLINSVDDTND
ncbi:MAG: TetR/AcrR family transcriptional regulator [Sphingomicrobium sp.]